MSSQSLIRYAGAMKLQLRAARPVFSLLAFLCTQSALVAFVLAAWRLGADLGWTGQFFLASGIGSHWQVWVAIGIALYSGGVFLGRFGRPEQPEASV